MLILTASISSVPSATITRAFAIVIFELINLRLTGLNNVFDTGFVATLLSSEGRACLKAPNIELTKSSGA